MFVWQSLLDARVLLQTCYTWLLMYLRWQVSYLVFQHPYLPIYSYFPLHIFIYYPLINYILFFCLGCEAGMKQLFVHVNADNKPAQDLYKKAGFQVNCFTFLDLCNCCIIVYLWVGDLFLLHFHHSNVWHCCYTHWLYLANHVPLWPLLLRKTPLFPNLNSLNLSHFA